MYYFILILIGYLSWALGIFGFCQIIGCIRQRCRPFTILFWIAVITGVSFLVVTYLHKYIWGYIIGIAISFIKVLLLDKIE